MEQQFRHTFVVLTCLFMILFIPFNVHQAYGDGGGYYSPSVNYRTTILYPYNLIKKVQKELMNRGYKIGKIDGIWGSRTSECSKGISG